MEYMSTIEKSKEWGISPTRITILAKSGRIPGAQQKGSHWLIPTQAQKPIDGRKKKEPSSKDSYRFPFFLYLFQEDHQPTAALDQEAQCLYDAQMHYVCNRLPFAADQLDTLIQTTKNRYLLIGALVTRGFVAIELREVDIYKQCLQRLTVLFSEEFPCKEELLYYFYDLRSYAVGSDQWAMEFHLNPDSTYHVEAGPYLTTNIAYAALIKLAGRQIPTDPSLLEIGCLGLGDRGYFFSTQMTHIFLAGIYFLQEKESYCISHLKKALDIAIKHDSYYPLAIASLYLSNLYEKVLPAYPQEVAEKIRIRSEQFQGGVEEIYLHFSKRSSLLSLSPQDYEYILFAIRGFKNKEIAHRKGLSEPTVSKKYVELYEKVNVQNKKELVELFRDTILPSTSPR